MEVRGVLPLAVLLVGTGCSDGGDVEPGRGVDPDGYLIGGVDCAEASVLELEGVVVDASGEPVVPAVDADSIDCYTPPLTDLPGPGTASLGGGFLSFADRSVAVDNLMAIDENLSRLGPSSHAGIHFMMHDGATRTLAASDPAGARREDYGAFGATIALTGDLYAAGGGTLDGRTFRFGTIEDGDPASMSADDVFTGGVLVFEADGDGTIEEGEFFRIVDGQVTWTGSAPAVALDMNLVLDDGSALTGHYEGDVLELDLFPDE